MFLGLKQGAAVIIIIQTIFSKYLFIKNNLKKIKTKFYIPLFFSLKFLVVAIQYIGA